MHSPRLTDKQHLRLAASTQSLIAACKLWQQPGDKCCQHHACCPRSARHQQQVQHQMACCSDPQPTSRADQPPTWLWDGQARRGGRPTLPQVWCAGCKHPTPPYPGATHQQKPSEVVYSAPWQQTTNSVMSTTLPRPSRQEPTASAAPGSCKDSCSLPHKHCASLSFRQPLHGSLG